MSSGPFYRLFWLVVNGSFLSSDIRTSELLLVPYSLSSSFCFNASERTVTCMEAAGEIKVKQGG